MRLNAFLARAGVASRRRADELIKAGRVTVNGEPGQLNTVVGARDRVEVDGQAVERQRLRYVLLHKPTGVVTTARDPQGRPTVVELVPHEPRVVPVGRLDADTTGALLLTNDGQLAHRLAHPRYGVEKTYVAEVEGDPGRGRAAATARGHRARRRTHRSGASAPPRPRPCRARSPRGTQAPGQADARCRRPPRRAAAPERVRRADARRARARRMPGARALRGRAATSRLAPQLAAEACSRARDSAAPGRDATPGCARRR